MKILELFAGSRSVGKIGDSRGHQVCSVDIEAFEDIDIVIDILELKRDMIPFVPDMIWASPPCTYFSVASIGHHWNENNTPKTEEAIHGLEILRKTLDVFTWFPNSVFYMENPCGKMRRIVKGIDRRKLTYCSYGDFRMKPTDLWSNNFKDIFNPNGFEPLAPCFAGNDKCHHEAAPRGSKTGTQGQVGNYERSKIPEALCLEIIKQTEKK